MDKKEDIIRLAREMSERLSILKTQEDLKALSGWVYRKPRLEKESKTLTHIETLPNGKPPFSEPDLQPLDLCLPPGTAERFSAYLNRPVTRLKRALYRKWDKKDYLGR